MTLCVARNAMARPVVLQGRAQVIDGDTLVMGKRHIRLFGVDAFEHNQTCGRMRCGLEATQALRDMTKDQIVTCEKQDVDRYGRLVAICKSSGRDLGRDMIRRGLAVDYRVFTRRYMDDETYAKSRKIGAWAHGFQSPETFRQLNR
ncbi:MAG: thermonuclease family protein [Asticcacaulis sp.]